MRIGHGYDVHRLVSGRPLFLGGIEIPYQYGLDGHSDADVLLHALMDALLGASCLPDIGVLFPPDDTQYLGVRSTKLLHTVSKKLKLNNWNIINIDATILAQAPKMHPYILSMRNCIADILGISLDQINIKATTEEGLGFTGRGEGIAAHVVCLLDK